MATKAFLDSDVLAIDLATGFGDIHEAEPMQRIDMIRSGVPASEAKALLAQFSVPLQDLAKALDIPQATLNRKASQNKPLSNDESERVLGLAALAGQVEVMVEESGDPEGFEPAEWLSGWMQTETPSLGWRRPLDLLDTIEGQSLISDTLARMQSGAYA